jgi:hypothetical protein
MYKIGLHIISSFYGSFGFGNATEKASGEQARVEYDSGLTSGKRVQLNTTGL